MGNFFKIQHSLIMGFVFTLLNTVNGYGQVCGLAVGDKFALPKSVKETGTTGVSPLEKEIKVVSLLDPTSPSFEKELEVWKHFILGVDTSHVGFVFLLTTLEDPGAFIGKWRNEAGLDYPFFYDHQLNCILQNPAQNAETTILVNNEHIVLTGKSPVTNEPYNLYRSKLDNLLRSRGIAGGVKGAIIEEVDGIVKTRFSSDPVYVDQNGRILTREKAREMILSRSHIPELSPLSDTVRLNLKNY